MKPPIEGFDTVGVGHGVSLQFSLRLSPLTYGAPACLRYLQDMALQRAYLSEKPFTLSRLLREASL